MNISLLDDHQSRIVSRRFLFFSCSNENYIRILKRGVVWLRRKLRKKSFIALTACWRDSTASSSSSSASIPYHRLQYEISELSEVLLVHNPPKQHQDRDYELSCRLRFSYGEDTVVVKVGIVGDCQTGKTSLMENYVGGTEAVDLAGVSFMDKVFDVQSAKIALSIWDLGGYRQLMAPAVCNDAAAILILFDLTRRTTLHSVKQWFVIARQCNQVALPVLVGTKFDQFIKMPESLKLLITKQARLYAKAMGAPLLFTSIPYNINVHKVFKIALARIFDLPCNISKNLNPGEPLVVY